MTKKDDAIEAYEFLLWNAKVREDALTLKVERLRQLNHELETENLDLRDTLEWRDERCAETYYELVELKAELAAAKQSLDYANQRLEEQVVSADPQLRVHPVAGEHQAMAVHF